MKQSRHSAASKSVIAVAVPLDFQLPTAAGGASAIAIGWFCASSRRLIDIGVGHDDDTMLSMRSFSCMAAGLGKLPTEVRFARPSSRQERGGSSACLRVHNFLFEAGRRQEGLLGALGVRVSRLRTGQAKLRQRLIGHRKIAAARRHACSALQQQRSGR